MHAEQVSLTNYANKIYHPLAGGSVLPVVLVMFPDMCCWVVVVVFFFILLFSSQGGFAFS